MNSTDLNANTILTLNKFYLDKLNKLRSSKGAILTSSELQSQEDEIELYKSCVEVMAQMMSLTYGMFIGITGGDIDYAKKLFEGIIDNQIELSTVEYKKIYEEIKNGDKFKMEKNK